MRVVPLLVALLLQGVPPPSGSIEGVVIRAGTTPVAVLENARLELAGVGDPVVGRTDSAGRFAFPNLPAGNYRLRITKDGYVRQEYRQLALDKPGPPLVLKAGQRVDNVVFRLEPAPTIAGMIREASEARAVGTVVQALKRGYDARGNPSLKLIASTVTDDQGVYRLFWLDPGEYFIAATPPPPQPGTSRAVAYVPTYFPSSVEIDAATPVRLDYGQQAVGIDFKVFFREAMALSGYVTSLQQGPVSANVLVVPPEDGSGVARYAGKSSPLSGSYGISGVPPGTYLVSATLGKETSTIRVRLKYNPALTLRVDLRIGEGIAISGRALTDSPIDSKNMRIHLSEVDPALPEPALAAIAANNQFVLPAVQPGSYTVQVDGLVNDQYLKAATFGAADALEQPIAVTNTAAPELQVQIASDGGRVTGAVYDRNDALLPNAEVILVPMSVSRFRFDRYRTAVTGDDGRFTIRGIAPGDYKVFAWESLEPNAHLNVDFMRPFESTGIPVHVEPNSNGTVSLRAISRL
jgi:uncharacterized protein (DUF2141 family)